MVACRTLRACGKGHLVDIAHPGGGIAVDRFAGLRGNPLVNRNHRRILQVAEQLHYKVDKARLPACTQRAGTLALLLFEADQRRLRTSARSSCRCWARSPRACARHEQDLLISFKQLSDGTPTTPTTRGGRADPARRRLPRPSRQAAAAGGPGHALRCAGARRCQTYRPVDRLRQPRRRTPGDDHLLAAGHRAHALSIHFPEFIDRCRDAAVRGRRLARSRVARSCQLRGFGLRSGCRNCAGAIACSAVFAASQSRSVPSRWTLCRDDDVIGGFHGGSRRATCHHHSPGTPNARLRCDRSASGAPDPTTPPTEAARLPTTLVVRQSTEHDRLNNAPRIAYRLGQPRAGSPSRDQAINSTRTPPLRQRTSPARPPFVLPHRSGDIRRIAPVKRLRATGPTSRLESRTSRPRRHRLLNGTSAILARAVVPAAPVERGASRPAVRRPAARLQRGRSADVRWAATW